jgi:hypothetical protein
MKAGEWMYLCVAHGNDGAMEASLIIPWDRKKKPSLTAAVAMLRHRLHLTHRRQRNGAPQLTTSVPITVRAHAGHMSFLSHLLDLSPQD